VNEITLVPASVAETAENIRKALVRNATVDANRLEVAVAGTIVTLTGKVRSYVERKQAEAAAWASPHVTDVHNDVRITLGPNRRVASTCRRPGPAHEKRTRP
jgi:osmotically-inducible protein OsmY